mmetsp:Transcript_5356/g.8815  ORF Transcript_5356/g.8815 Transcript_5356/m.8815 type:complete len:131 (+) Transcript_5356:42-434(+)
MNPRVLPVFSSKVSNSLQDAQYKVRHLYREVQKQVPNIIRLYNLEIEPVALKEKLAHEFRKNANVVDPKVIDVLAFKGKLELEETLTLYKTRSHVMRYLMGTSQKKDIVPPQQSEPGETDFLRRFYAGHD